MNPSNATPDRHEPDDELELDRLLTVLAHKVPDGFTSAVMREVQAQRLHSVPVSVASHKQAEPLTFIQWVLLLGGGLLGVSQMGSFVLGLWAASAAW